MREKIKPFMNDDFLLNNKVASQLYHDVAKVLPIVDVHSFLPISQLAYNVQFQNITQLWIAQDHYKWRLMRMHGVEESYITGKASDEDKFQRWASVLSRSFRHPLYHWSHQELKYFFGIEELLHAGNAKEIYQQCNEVLEERKALDVLYAANVEVLGTDDDIAEGLGHHTKYQNAKPPINIVPTFRPDKLMAIENASNFSKYITKLERLTDKRIRNLTDLLGAVYQRVGEFHALGCRTASHRLNTIPTAEFTYEKANQVFIFARRGRYVSEESALLFKSALMYFLSEMYHSKGWVQQFHLGAYRNINTKLLSSIGVNNGSDTIADQSYAKAIIQYLDSLDKLDKLPKTVLYNFNPNDNEVFSSIAGSFTESGIAGKVQHGAASWFLNNERGILRHFETISNHGLVAHSIGTVSDARSLLSMQRHDYYRRLICNRIGEEVHEGKLPDDKSLLSAWITQLFYQNAKSYFGFD